MIDALDEYVSGKNIYELNIFQDSPILPLQEQYAQEAKFFYGETEKYKEVERSLEKLSPTEKADLYTSFEQNMERVFRRMSCCINQAPSMVCDREILAYIANTLVFYMTQLCITLIRRRVSLYKKDHVVRNEQHKGD